MSHRRTIDLVRIIAIAACLVGLGAMAAMAAPSAAQTSADRAAVERAVKQYEAAKTRSARVDARIAETSADLDGAVAEEKQARNALRSRVLTMYRSGDADFISVLLGASTVQDFAARWDLLARIARQDAVNLRTLKAARAEAERSAEQLIDLQSEEARALDAMADEVARAKKKLASSQAALREYEARTAASAAAPAATAPKPAAEDPTQKLSGSGAWQTAVASHYGRDFSGRGASGEEIGPYSMIVAHRTLPFGTLIEFEYEGRRAVARVADRGPHAEDREFDLGPGVVRVLNFSGVHEVRYRIISQ
ncbi:MAG: septal ring lytic transglycosylase RlpA family protein [Actinomycetota bacterium]|nr:septal ring lytic transglycosylase RlpA family protein [Actinomycetota bacterium]